MPDLIVNVDHTAAFRNLTPGRQPDPVGVAVMAEVAGAVGVSARFTEDRRQISDRDIRVLRETVQGRFSLGVAPTPEMMGLVLDVKPDEVVLIPDRPEEASAEGGLDLILDRTEITDTITTIRDSGIPVFLFVDPDPEHVKSAHRLNADGVQINTGIYAGHASPDTRERMLARIVDTVKVAARLKLRIWAGHGLDYQTCRPLGEMTEVEACVIGHSLMARALLTGIETAVREMIIALERG
ncbi:MAG: pyridoxine 5'-phosphate synthase [Desulfobacterales bacterium]|nr:pyridoxine 5'-phosphate synthase [Desulfobacterales bacterium]MDJ0875453.1 pyridoxine 5'-phosphate synthase [Desulfobacterales bacterium]MDJ0882782.1 pyridoxine 5'-phosphate synthase [Desulfobacterales bacterium]